MTTTKIDLPARRKPVRKLEKPIDWQHAAEWFVTGMEKNPSEKHISDMITLLNNWLIETSVQNSGVYPLEAKKAAAEIVHFFSLYHTGDSDEEYEKACLKLDDLLLFQLGTAEIEEERKVEFARQEKKYKKFPIRVRQSIDALFDFLCSQNTMVVIDFLQNGEEMFSSYLDPEEEERVKELTHSSLRANLIKTWNVGGAFIIEIDDESAQMQDVYGCVIGNKRAFKLEPENLEEMFEEDLGIGDSAKDKRFLVLPVDLYN